MARVLTKKSTVAAKVPLATDLEIGELAVNTADAKLYTKHSDNTVKQLGIATTDSRLTDAREWTASTVTQSEAEAGTATTRRAWTALRVFQAIAAWWAASAMKTKLDGIAAGATANATDAQLRDRATHTGSQAISTVTGLQAALDNKINTSERGVSGGIATLDEFARIPASQLPSYVDDVLEYATTAQFPATGETGKIYIAINQGTAANPTRQYRWTGSTYAEINPSPGTTDALAEGSTNLYFSEHRVRTTVLTGLSMPVAAAITAADTVLSALGKIQARLNLMGTAANANVQTSPTDTTAGALMAVGAFGVGTRTTPSFPSLADLPGGGLNGTVSQIFNLTAAGLPIGDNLGGWVVNRGGRPCAFLFPNDQRLAMTRFDGTGWTSPVEFFSTGNLSPVETSRQLTAGAGLTGGGSLAADRTLALGTPSTISTSSSNSVSSTSHTHALSIPAASTSETGLVQLNNTLTSTSTSQALTAAQGKKLQDEKLPISRVQSSPTDTTAGAVTTTEGARFAVLANYGAYYSSSGGKNIDTLVGGESGLFSTSNPGTFPPNFGSFVYIETQQTYTNSSVVQEACDYGSSSAPIGRKAFRVRSNSGGEWSAWQVYYHSGNFDPAAKQDKSSIISTATSRTLALTDAWNYLRPGTTGSITLTVPTNASVAFEIGTEITVRALGNVTLASASGVTLNAPSGGTLSMTARMTVTLKKVGTNEWDVIGQTVAA